MLKLPKLNCVDTLLRIQNKKISTHDAGRKRLFFFFVVNTQLCRQNLIVLSLNKLLRIEKKSTLIALKTVQKC